VAVASRLARFGKQIRERILRLPPAFLVAAAAILVAGTAVGGVLLYRTYDYVQHDNEFCMSCHLMRDPFDRFAQSAHRGLGCKACHQPTMMVRTQMALTQILENPDEIVTHAHVPNSVCAECHIRGNPDRWLLIAASAGHRVHLESTDPSLRGLQCVQCHSSSLHEFAATDRTCAQSGCHETTEVRLGRMGQLTIHCVSCHEFNAPVAATAPADTLAIALRPQREQCLSCHAMRTLARDFPEPHLDPHAGACGACHDPHSQTTPAQAVQTCAVGGCHERVDTASVFHRGLAVGVLTQCTQCHTAHEFGAPTQCLQCHQGIYQAAPMPFAATQAGRPTAAGMQFNHAQHRNVDCTACHDTRNTHGAVVITSFTECRQCHHTGPVAQRCTACHETRELRQPLRIPQPVRVAGRVLPQRQLPFNHAQHLTEPCSACHQPGLAQSAANVTCTSCHEQHHRSDTNCRACHQTPPATAHTVASHLTCTGAGCHQAQPVRGDPRTREVCMSCHTGLVDHMPGRNCIDCHALPRPTAAAPKGGEALRALVLKENRP
jgi:nitrate/TMAO reductase-like tetraheme cytochrome c subunit